MKTEIIRSNAAALLLFGCACSAVGQAPQAEPADSSATQLQEVVITAPTVIRKSDKDLYIPSDMAREYSSNGLALLQNLQIPTLSVNTFLESVSNPSGAVQLRINGRVATVREVRNLQPASIVRVEYIENPGLRYGNATAVLDFIVRNPAVGGSLMTDLMYWIDKVPSGNLSASLKLNRGKGQFGLSVTEQLRKRTSMYREYEETFRLPDGSVLYRHEQPHGGMYNNNQLWATADYSYIDPDRLTLYAALKFEHQVPNSINYDGLMTSERRNGDATSYAEPIYLSVMQRYPMTIPSVNIYADYSIGKNQSLIVDLVGRHTGQRAESWYHEQAMDGQTQADISNRVRDNNWSLGVEADYIRRWQHSRLTAGLAYNGYFNKSTYLSAGDAVYHQRENMLYAFAEYMHTLGEVTLTGGIGAEYNSQRMKEASRSLHSWHPRPRVSVSWRHGWSMLRLSGSGHVLTPSLTQTNPTVQQIDRFQYQVGNPDLKSYTAWRATLDWNQTFSRFNTGLQMGYRTTSGHAIDALYYWDARQRLIRTFANDNRDSRWWTRLSAQVEIIPDWLTASGYVDMTRYYSRGTCYRHTHTSWSGNADVSLSHWGFQLAYSYQRVATALEGEDLRRWESFNALQLTYNIKDWQVGAAMLMPFGRYNQEHSQLNRLYSYRQIVRSDFIERKMVVTVAYNLRWGRQNDSARKRIDAGPENRSSSAAGR